MARRTISVTDTAKLVRDALKAQFPRQKFSVRSSNYAGGCSIDVRWTDGPTEPQVNAITSLYRGASFDGTTDMMSYHDSILSTEDGAEVVSFVADFIQAHRTFSPGFRADLEAEIADFTGLPFDANQRYEASTGREGEQPIRLYNDHHCGEWGNSLVHQLGYDRAREVAR